MPDVQELIRRCERLRSDRTAWDAHWQETAERVLPRAAEFMARNQAGTKQTQKYLIQRPSWRSSDLRPRWRACSRRGRRSGTKLKYQTLS